MGGILLHYLARIIDIGLLYIDVKIMIKIDCEGCEWNGATTSSIATFTSSSAHYFLTTIEQEKGRERQRQREHYHVVTVM